MAKRVTEQNAGDESNQIGVVNGNVEIVEEKKGGLGSLSTGCLIASGVILVVSVVVLILALSAGMTFIQNLASQQQSPTSPPANTQAASALQGSISSSSGLQVAVPTSLPAALPTQALPARIATGVEGEWILLFNDAAWGHSYYTLNFSRSGFNLSGTSRITSVDYPGCYQDFSLSGLVLASGADGINIELTEAYLPPQCQVFGYGADIKSLELTYTNGPEGEALKGTLQAKSYLAMGTAFFVRPSP